VYIKDNTNNNEIMSSQMKWLIIIICSILSLFLNFAVIDKLIIPDPCYYHTNEMNPILNLFYTSSSASGGHPEMNLFNIIFTIIIGGLIGKLVCNLYEMKIKTE